MTAIAWLTLAELWRRRLVLAAGLGMLAFAALSAWGFSRIHEIHNPGDGPLSPLEVESAASVLLILVVYMISFVLTFAAALSTSPALSSNVESGVLLPVLARPLTRAKIVIGRAVGLAIALVAYTVFAASLEFLTVRATTGYFPPHPLAATAALCALGLVMMAFTLALAARLRTMAAAMLAVMAFGAEWVMGIIAGLGTAYQNEVLIRLGTISQLLLPSDAMWRTTVYQLEPAILINRLDQAPRGLAGPFFLVQAPPPIAMQIWTVLWIFAAVGVAAWIFSSRDF